MHCEVQYEYMTSIQYSACHKLWSAPTFRVGFYCRHPARVISWLPTPWRLNWVTVVPGLTLAYYCNTCWPFYLIRTDFNEKLGNSLVKFEYFEFFIISGKTTAMQRNYWKPRIPFTFHLWLCLSSLFLCLQVRFLDNQGHVLTIVDFFQTDQENTRKYEENYLIHLLPYIKDYQ